MEKIKREDMDVFTGDGCLEGEYRNEPDDTVKPLKLSKRRVPLIMITPLKDELELQSCETTAQTGSAVWC